MESFSKLFRKCQDFETIPNIRAFLYVTTRNACLDHLRYANESEQRLTLLEGPVKVSAGKPTSTLAPGQQAPIKEAIKVVSDVDPDEVIAWVGGKFKFQSEGIETICAS